MKAFLCHSGLDEFPAATRADLEAAAPILAKHNRPLLVHAELTSAPAPKLASTRSYTDYLATRPPQWEMDAIRLLIELCRDSGCRVHIVHLANADALPAIALAKRGGITLTVETCPHYLHFSADAPQSLDVVELVMELEDQLDTCLPDAAADSLTESHSIPDGDPRFKCAPPIRERRHQELLWLALRRGLIDTIGSDHSPCLPEMKCLESGDLMNAWGGIASLELTLPIVWTGAAARGIAPEKLFDWLSAAPAKLVGVDDCKGRITPGGDADLIVWDPSTRWTVNGQELRHRHKISPYEGAALMGQIRRTYIGGHLACQDGRLIGAPSGQLLKATSRS
jgi:allantoinase